MNIFSVTVSLLMAGLALAPLADAAQSKKPTSSKTSKSTKSAKPNKKQTPKPKPTPKPAPAPEPASAPEAPPATETAPAPADEQMYNTFVQKLNEQVSLNSYDCCPALSTALAGNNNDEFAVINWMKRASDAGNAAAQYYVAAQVLSSPHAQPNSPEVANALATLKKSADQGFVPAQLDYAVFLRTGRGIPKDEKASDALLVKACTASKGDANFQARFKWLLLTGRLNTADDIKRPEVKSEIDRGNHYVLYYISYYFPDSQKLKMLEQAAQMGNMDAAYTIGTYMTTIDPKKGFELLQIATERHNELAIFIMANIMLKPTEGVVAPLGLKEDLPTGMQFMRVSYLMGNGEAGLTLGNIYYDGLFGEAVNKERAYQHYREAFENHANPTAQAAQGLLLLKGEGVQQDTKKGLALIEMANQAGAPNAPILLAYAHYEGLGCEKDAAAALDCLQDAPNTNMSLVYVFMAYIYAKGGVNVEADPSTADSYIRMAELDLGPKARELFDGLMKAGKWEPHP